MAIWLSVGASVPVWHDRCKILGTMDTSCSFSAVVRSVAEMAWGSYMIRFGLPNARSQAGYILLVVRGLEVGSSTDMGFVHDTRVPMEWLMR